MVYVLKACADQTESITVALKQEGLPPLTIYDFTSSYKEETGLSSKYTSSLTSGAEPKMLTIMDKGSKVLDVVERVVWKGEPTVFGPVVSCGVFPFLCD
jgi:hypothetical protein